MPLFDPPDEVAQPPDEDDDVGSFTETEPLPSAVPVQLPLEQPPDAEPRAETSTLMFSFVARCEMQASTSVALTNCPLQKMPPVGLSH